MPFFGFPFQYGSESAVASVSTEEPVVAGGRWTNITSGAQAWGLGRPSTVRQFHRIHPQTAITFGSSVNFAYRVTDSFPLRVDDGGDAIHVASTITTP